jgi:uncharacterized protein
MKISTEKQRMEQLFTLLLIGLAGGVLSGLVGLGGGVIIVPALVAFLGFTQPMAQGTTLAMMVPPVGILAVWNYYRQGHVDLKVAGLLCCGFVVGGLVGSVIALKLDPGVLKKVFSIVLVAIAAKLFFTK